MPVDLAALVAPGRAALITSEIQNGVVGERAVLPELAAVARATTLPAIGRLVNAARAAGVQVIHATIHKRPDLKGGNTNARIFMAVRRSPVRFLPGTPEVEVVPDVSVEPEDLVLTRTHGLNPMAGTDLDPILRNLGVRTLIVTGVSVNIAVTNLVLDAVNHGYDVVLPRDAVCGVPPEYADAVIDNTLSLLSTVTTVDELASIWGE